MDNELISILQKKGVSIPNPESVFISEEVDPDRISAGNVTIHAGCKIFGSSTLIMENSVIGHEAPVTLENTIIGKNTHLKGGYFKGAVFAGDNVFGSGAHVREGTILEEQANAAHTVGLKQTILFPYVTLGSLVNFCDCFMTGGTSRKDHSEIGSSFIHFNYTPNQDKATPSMMGNVHEGVMLDKKPIFLGGQGGLVGPVRIGYGCISAAGSILRKNEEREDRLLLGGGFKETSLPRNFKTYTNIDHIYNNNIIYISELIALKAWYKQIRSLFFKEDEMTRSLHQAMCLNLDLCIKERIRRLKDFGEKLALSRQTLTDSGTKNTARSVILHNTAVQRIEKADTVFDTALKEDGIDPDGEAFITYAQTTSKDEAPEYLPFIKQLPGREKQIGSRWLHGIGSGIADQLIIKQDKSDG